VRPTSFDDLSRVQRARGDTRRASDRATTATGSGLTTGVTSQLGSGLDLCPLDVLVRAVRPPSHGAAGRRHPTRQLHEVHGRVRGPGLYHLRTRQYDPTWSRFLSPDPVSSPVGSPYVAAYVYGGNRPTVMVDPSGKIFEPSGCGRMLAAEVASPRIVWAGVGCGTADRRSQAPAATEVLVGCSISMTPPYLNQVQGRVESLVVWRCWDVISVSVFATLRRDNRLVDSWTNWNPFQLKGEHTLRERCDDRVAKYQSDALLDYRALAWPPWGRAHVQRARVRISC
jgi:RHS repeat-associated protein